MKSPVQGGYCPRVVMSAAILAASVTWSAPSQAAGCTLTTVELPVHMVGRRAIAMIGIDGQQVPMMVDTGAWFSTLPESVAAQLHLSPRHVPNFAIYGIVGKADARIASASLTLAKGTLPNVQFIVGGNDLDSGAMGLLGRNILSVTDAEYDLAHGVIRFIHPSDECAKANMAYWAGSTPVSVIQLSNTDPSPAPAIVAKAKLDDTSIDVFFDTGASTLVSLAGARHAGVKVEDMKPAGDISGIARGSAKAWMAAFPRFEIGGEAILNNHLNVADFELHDADMILGIDFFLSHHIYVSKQQSRMFFTYAGGPVFADNVQSPASDAAPTAGAADQLDADGYARRGEASRARGDLKGALADLDRACALEPKNAAFFDARASVHYALEDWKRVGEDYDTALRLDPELAHARLGRAYLRQFTKDRDGALADLAYLDKTLAPQAQTRFALATSYGELGEHARAVAQLDLWIASHARDNGLPSAYNTRCWQRVALGTELDKALSDCTASIDLVPTNAYSVDSRAWVWLRMGEWEKSLGEFDRALALKPQLVSSLYGKGIVERRLGNQAASDRDIAAARELRPEIDANLKRDGMSIRELGGPS